MTPDIDTMVKAAQFETPGVRGVLIQGSHGGWGDENGSSRGISGPVDLAWMLSNRAAADAVLVSAKTAERESYRPISLKPEYRMARNSIGLKGTPALIIASRNPASVLTALEVADFVVTCGEKAVEDPRVITAGVDDIDWNSAKTQIRERGLVRIVCEGGPQLISALIAAGELDQLSLTTSPHIAAMQTEDEPAVHALTNFIASTPAKMIFESDGFSFALLGSLPTWDQRLNKSELFVLRHHGTEPAFSAEYEKKPAAGYYVCRACGSRLFDASDQFDARCGWPAFWQPSNGDQVKLIEDNSLGMRRVEVRCSACDSHLGHVFHGEGFGFPTDDRYCINAICLERRY